MHLCDGMTFLFKLHCSVKLQGATLLGILYYSVWPLVLLPSKALMEEGQAAKYLLTSVKLVHIRRCYHGDAMVVHDSKVVHTQTITHCNKNQKEQRQNNT